MSKTDDEIAAEWPMIRQAFAWAVEQDDRLAVLNYVRQNRVDATHRKGDQWHLESSKHPAAPMVPAPTANVDTLYAGRYERKPPATAAAAAAKSDSVNGSVPTPTHAMAISWFTSLALMGEMWARDQLPLAGGSALLGIDIATLLARLEVDSTLVQKIG